MKPIIICYKSCNTCRKAKKFLKDHNIEYIDRDIVENTPSKEELKLWLNKSGLSINKFYNTSGKVYRELDLKNKRKEMTEDEQLQLLSQHGMLIKRPLLILEDKVLVGFKEDDYKEAIV